MTRPDSCHRLSRCQVQSGLSRFKINWYRYMVMYDEPVSFNAPQAACHTKPRLRFLAALEGPRDSLEAVDEGDIVTGHNAKVAEFDFKRPLIHREELFVVFPVRVSPDPGERGDDVVRDDGSARCIYPHYGIDILCAKCLFPSHQQLPNLGLTGNRRWRGEQDWGMGCDCEAQQERKTNDCSLNPPNSGIDYA